MRSRTSSIRGCPRAMPCACTACIASTGPGSTPPCRIEASAPEKASMKIVAILLIVAGALALAYGGFSYTKDKTALKIGPLELNVKEKETVNVPVWAGVGAIVVGGLLLAFGGRSK